MAILTNLAPMTCRLMEDAERKRQTELALKALFQEQLFASSVRNGMMTAGLYEIFRS